MMLSIAEIRTDGGTQPRAELNNALIDEYADAMRMGNVFPPVTVFYDGTSYWLADGFHRLQAASRCDQAAIEVDIRQGTLAEAQWYSYSVNQSHGMRRSNEDKRRAVEAALSHPFAGRYSDNEIANHCGVHRNTILTYRNHLAQNVHDTPTQRIVTRNGTTYTMNTANIGQSTPATTPPPVTEQPELQQAEEELPAPDTHYIVFDEYGSQQSFIVGPDEELAVVKVTPKHDPVDDILPTEVTHDIGHLIKIIQGDARAEHDIDGVHMVITSPPYNVGIDYNTHNDDLTQNEYERLLTVVFRNCHRVMVDGARIAVVVPFGVGRNPWLPVSSLVQNLLTRSGFTLRGQIIWDKASTGNRTSWGSFRLPSDPSLRDTTEAIVIAHKGSSKLELPPSVVLHDEKGSHTGWLANADEFMTMAQDHWQIAPESAQRIGHPAPFPVALADRLIRFYGYPTCHVLDPFAGSGTVGVAALRLGCRATLVEIDSDYCRIAVSRCQEAEQHGRNA